VNAGLQINKECNNLFLVYIYNLYLTLHFQFLYILLIKYYLKNFILDKTLNNVDWPIQSAKVINSVSEDWLSFDCTCTIPCADIVY